MQKLAIIGLGQWGKNLIREFSKISNIVICSSTGNKENIKWLTKNYPKIQFTENIDDILENKFIDAVIVATPINTHYTLVNRILKSNKHVFVEKTLSENSSDAKKLITLAKNKKLTLFVGHIFLYHPILEKIKKINSDESIVYMNLSWNKLGTFREDIFLDLVSHFFSISMEIFGNPKTIKLHNFQRFVTSCDQIFMEFNFDLNRKCVIEINRISNIKNRSITIMTKKNIYQWNDDNLYKYDKKNSSFTLILKPKQTPLEIECKTFIRNLANMDYSNSDKALKIIQLIESCKRRF